MGESSRRAKSRSKSYDRHRRHASRTHTSPRTSHVSRYRADSRRLSVSKSPSDRRRHREERSREGSARRYRHNEDLESPKHRRSKRERHADSSYGSKRSRDRKSESREKESSKRAEVSRVKHHQHSDATHQSGSKLTKHHDDDNDSRLDCSDRQRKVPPPSEKITKESRPQESVMSETADPVAEDAASEEVKKYERLMKARRLLMQKKKSKAFSETSAEIAPPSADVSNQAAPTEGVIQKPDAEAEKKVADSGTSSETSSSSLPSIPTLAEFKLDTTKTLSEGPLLPGFNFEALPATYHEDYVRYLETSNEADPLDEYMTKIQAEMEEINLNPKRVKRRRKRNAANQAKIANSALSISMDEILKLQADTASTLQKSAETEEVPSSDTGPTGMNDAESSSLQETSTVDMSSVTEEHNETSSPAPEMDALKDPGHESDEDERYYRDFMNELKRKQEEAAQAENQALTLEPEDEVPSIAPDSTPAPASEDSKPALKAAPAPAAEVKSVVSSQKKDDVNDIEDEDEDYRYHITHDDDMGSYFDYAQRVGNRKELPVIDHSTIDYPPFNKNLYVQVRELSLMKDHQVDTFRKLNGNIRVRGKQCPKPVRTFYQCGLPDAILNCIEKREYEKPFPIQMQAIPALMAGRDVIGIAETGSGKTLAYLLPLLRHILDQPPLRIGDGCIGLILAPTRELTVQIQKESHKLSKLLNLTSIAVYGGTGIGEQLSALKRGAEILVATPGRLIDVLTINNGKVTNLRRVTFCILDEADRMFDMGFEPQITSIIRTIRPDAQKGMFSATFPTHIEGLARKILKKPIEIVVGERGQTAAHIEQFIEVWPTPKKKFLRLLQILGEWVEHGSIIIFVSRQVDADELFSELLQYGHTSLTLHGGQDQTDRDFTIRDFKSGTSPILIATSVAARGLDVKSVVLVINYNAPDHIEDYIHRIGRTGRAGNIGVAYTFVSPEEADKADDLIKILKQHEKEIPPSLLALSENYKLQCLMGIAKHHGRGGFGGKGFKFTPQEKSRQQLEQARAKKELGLNDSDEEDTTYNAAALDEMLENPLGPSVETSDPSKSGNLALAAAAAAAAAAISAAPSQPSAPLASIPGAGLLTSPGGPGLPSAMMEASTLPQEVDSASARAKALAELAAKTKQFKFQGGAGHEGFSTEDLIKNQVLLKSSSLPTTQMMTGPLNLQTSLALATQAAVNLINNAQKAMDPASLARISPSLGLSPLAYVDSATGNIVEEFEINDYPQTARFKITHKDVLNQIADQSGTVLQVKGRYIPPEEKKNIAFMGVKKLYIEIIGSTAIDIQRAKHELRSSIEAVSMKQLNLPFGAMNRSIGRYSVV